MPANVSSRLNLGEQLAALSPAQRKLLELRLMKKNRSAAKQKAIAHDPDRKTAPLERYDECEQLLLITMHHILTDGWAMSIFNRERSDWYGADTAGREPSLPELPIQYVDYAAW